MVKLDKVVNTKAARRQAEEIAQESSYTTKTERNIKAHH